MSQFLKLKGKNSGKRVLIAVSQITAVFEDDEGCNIYLATTGEEISVKEGYQTLVNRLAKDDADKA